MTCIVVVNIYNESAKSFVPEVEEFLKTKGYTCITVAYDGKNDVFPDIDFDFAVSLGGDGTVLYLGRKCVNKQKPIFPINFGEFGFIAGIHCEHWKRPMEDFLQKKLLPTSRSLLSIVVKRGDKIVFSEKSLNDVAIKSKKQMKTCALQVDANEIPFGKIKADGIIIATTTGSTAYSLAAGGPIVDPSIDAIVFNPIAAFSLSTRPIVLAGDTRLQIEVLPSRSENIMVSCDGQIHEDVHVGDVIEIKQFEKKALLVGCNSEVFYSAVRSKLHWSGGPFA